MFFKVSLSMFWELNQRKHGNVQRPKTFRENTCSWNVWERSYQICCHVSIIENKFCEIYLAISIGKSNCWQLICSHLQNDAALFLSFFVSMFAICIVFDLSTERWAWRKKRRLTCVIQQISLSLVQLNESYVWKAGSWMKNGDKVRKVCNAISMECRLS